MNILTIPIRCTQQKWPRTLAMVLVFLLGVASIVALHKVSTAVGDGLEKKLTSFGANIIISPKRESITISYGGIPLNSMLVDEGRINLPSTRKSISSIALHERLAVIAPKLVGMGSLAGKAVPIVGVDFISEVELKQFWNVNGTFPGMAAGFTGGAQMAMPFANPSHVDHTNAPEQKATTESAQPALPAENSPDNAMPGASAAQMALHNPPVAATEDSALAGANIAIKFHLTPGTVLDLGHGTSITLAGVLDPTGSDDDNVLFLPLALTQHLLEAKDQVSFIEVAALCAGCPIEDIVAQLSTALPAMDVKALQQIVAQRMYSVNFASSLALIVALVILVSACAMVTLSMFSAVNERRKEIGLLRAIGYSRGGIFIIFAAEAFGIGLISGLLGYCVGFLGGQNILTGLNLDAATLPPFSAFELLRSTLTASFVAVIAAALPALKAGRIDPATALADL